MEPGKELATIAVREGEPDLIVGPRPEQRHTVVHVPRADADLLGQPRRDPLERELSLLDRELAHDVVARVAQDGFDRQRGARPVVVTDPHRASGQGEQPPARRVEALHADVAEPEAGALVQGSRDPPCRDGRTPGDRELVGEDVSREPQVGEEAAWQAEARIDRRARHEPQLRLHRARGQDVERRPRADPEQPRRAHVGEVQGPRSVLLGAGDAGGEQRGPPREEAPSPARDHRSALTRPRSPRRHLVAAGSAYVKRSGFGVNAATTLPVQVCVRCAASWLPSRSLSTSVTVHVGSLGSG